MTRQVAKFLTVLILAVLVAAVPTTAQDEEAVSEAAEDAEVAPAEEFTDVVTVTARKREENLQEVPFSVVAPTEEILRRSRR